MAFLEKGWVDASGDWSVLLRRYEVAVDKAINAGLCDDQIEVRRAASRLLPVRSPSVDQVVLLKLVRDPDPMFRANSLAILGHHQIGQGPRPNSGKGLEIRSLKVVTAVMNGLIDIDLTVRVAAMKALNSLKAAGLSGPSEPILSRLRALEQGASDAERELAFATEFHWTPSHDQFALAQSNLLAGGLARRATLHAIGDNDSLFDDLIESSPDEVCLAVLLWLSSHERGASFRTLTVRMSSPSIAIRVEATRVMSMAPPEAPPIAVLRQNLNSSSRDLRRATAELIGALGSAATELVPELGARLLDRDTIVRVAAVAAIERLGHSAEPAVPQLVLALDNSSAVVQRILLRVLSEIHSSTDVDLEFGRAKFEQIAGHGPMMARRGARTLLSLIGDR